jgi:hypothetical protein
MYQLSNNLNPHVVKKKDLIQFKLQIERSLTVTLNKISKRLPQGIIYQTNL